MLSLSTRNRHRTIVTGLVGVSLAVSACSVAGSDSGQAAGDTVRIVLPLEPPTLEPCQASLTSTGVVVRSNITEPLTERNPDSGDLEPKLATAWEQTEPTTWSFTIREGVTFSDGTPFDAEAAAFSIDRAVNGDLSCDVEGAMFGDEDLVLDAPDATTLTVRTTKPDPILPLRISFIEMVPPSTGTDKKVREPIGTGPYTIKKWDVGQKITLERRETYWGEEPAYRIATYEWREEGSIRAAMVTKKEVDLATGLSPEDGAGDLGVAFPNNETTLLRITALEPPLDDLRVRQAINYAIDRSGIVASLYDGVATPAAQLVPKGVVGHNAALEPWPYDVEEAKALIAQAEADGVPVDKQIRIIGRNGHFPKVGEALQAVQNQLTDIGLDVKLEMMETAAQLPYVVRPFPEGAGPYIAVNQHGNQAGDAAFSVDQFMLREGYQSSIGSNAFDDQIRSAGAATGSERQVAYEKIFEQEPTEIGQLVYIAHMTGILGKSADVEYTPDSATGDEMRLADMKPAVS